MISFEDNEKRFNLRVAAIILNEKKDSVLIHTIKGYDFWLLPGGRMEYMEGAQDAISREMREELGLAAVNYDLRVVSENFFNWAGRSCHELTFSYLTVLDQKADILQRKGEFHGVEGEKQIFKWHKIGSLREINFKPQFMVHEIETIHEKRQVSMVTVDEREDSMSPKNGLRKKGAGLNYD